MSKVDKNCLYCLKDINLEMEDNDGGHSSGRRATRLSSSKEKGGGEIEPLTLFQLVQHPKGVGSPAHENIIQGHEGDGACAICDKCAALSEDVAAVGGSGSYSHKQNFRHEFATQPRQTVITNRRMGTRCSNCETDKTALWRRNASGEPVCNACGLYFKTQGVARPLTLMNDGELNIRHWMDEMEITDDNVTSTATPREQDLTQKTQVAKKQTFPTNSVIRIISSLDASSRSEIDKESEFDPLQTEHQLKGVGSGTYNYKESLGDGFATQPRKRLGRKIFMNHFNGKARVGKHCSNCGTDKTTLWRRNESRQPVCNACGLYFKVYGVTRPRALETDNIRPRKEGQSKEVD